MKKIILMGLCLGVSVNCFADFSERDNSLMDLTIKKVVNCFFEDSIYNEVAISKEKGKTLNEIMAVVLGSDTLEIKSIVEKAYSNYDSFKKEFEKTRGFYPSASNYGNAQYKKCIIKAKEEIRTEFIDK